MPPPVVLMTAVNHAALLNSPTGLHLELPTNRSSHPCCEPIHPAPRLACLVGQRRAVDGHSLAVALHAQLLDVWRKVLQRLLVRQDGGGGVAQEGGVPHLQGGVVGRWVRWGGGLYVPGGVAWGLGRAVMPG